jgi:hypothetical protein
LIREFEFGCSIATEACLKTGTGAHENAPNGHLLLTGNEPVTGFMARHPAQTHPSSREGFRQKMTTHPLELGRIEGETQQPATDKQSDPARRKSHQWTEHREACATGHCQTGGGGGDG